MKSITGQDYRLLGCNATKFGRLFTLKWWYLAIITLHHVMYHKTLCRGVSICVQQQKEAALYV
jgi:hypothetical protein